MWVAEQILAFREGGKNDDAVCWLGKKIKMWQENTWLTFETVVYSTGVHILYKVFFVVLHTSLFFNLWMSQDNSISRATRLWAGRLKFNFWQGQESFLFSEESRLALGSTKPPSQWLLGTSSPGLKQQGCEADHSLPCSAEAKNGAILPLPLCLHGNMLNYTIKCRDNFYLLHFFFVFVTS
jgi:hypothetical protein